MTIDTLFKSALLILSIYHIITGIVSAFFFKFALKFYKKLYDQSVQDNEIMFLILKPWGALAIFSGIAGLFAFFDPERYIGVIIGIIILLTLRIWFRYKYRKQMYRLFNTKPHRNFISSMIIFACWIILFMWLIITYI